MPGFLGGQPDRYGIETGALDEDVHGRAGDARLLAAHDPGQGDGLVLVGDDQHLRGELDRPAVEALELLPLLGPADDDPAAGELLEVECVDGLARREEDVVRHVDDVVDGPQAHGLDPLPEPIGRGPDGDAADEEAAVARAEGLVEDLDVGEVGRRLLELVRPATSAREPGAGHRRDLPGDPEVAERVGPVGVGLDFEDAVPPDLFRLLGDEADHGQPLEELGKGEVHLHVFVEPIQTDLHLRLNCLRNRRSFS